MENQTKNWDNAHELEADLHPNTPAEMKKLILDLNKSAAALQEYIDKTDALAKEDSEPEHYVGFNTNLFYNNGKKSRILSKRAMNYADCVSLLKKSIREYLELIED